MDIESQPLALERSQLPQLRRDHMSHSKTEQEIPSMRIGLLALVATLLWSTAPVALGQTSPCLPADTISTSVVNNLNQLLTSTEPTEVALKNSLGLNNVSPSQLTLVTTGIDCTKARQGVDVLFNTPNSNRRMHVVKAGNKRFVVKDQNGEALFVFDNKWAFVQTVSPG